MDDVKKIRKLLTYNFVNGQTRSVDLSKLKVDTTYYNNNGFRNCSSITETSTRTTYFCDIKAHLIERISKADTVLCCISWFTDEEIINSMSTKKLVRVVVNKEDWLRRDSAKPNTRVREAYKVLPKDKITGLDPVRCMGVHVAGSALYKPYMHHKFVIFANENPENSEEFFPYAVWVGSFNFTLNGSNSLDSASYTESVELATRYCIDFGFVYALSEELDWTVPWVEKEAPQW